MARRDSFTTDILYFGIGKLKLKSAAVCVAALAVCALVLDPLRDIPLDDDWLYFLAVRALLEEGALRIPELATVSLVAHSVWGTLFGSVFGLSHGVLRVSTLVLSAVALSLTGVFGGSRSDRARPEWALLANPLFFVLSFTFMTDVPLVAWSLLSLWLFRRADEKDRAGLWLAASLAGALAYLVRQTGLLVPIGAAIALGSLGRMNRRRLALALLPCAAVVLVHQLWFWLAHGPNWGALGYAGAASAHYFSEPRLFFWQLYARLAASALYLGLFTAPLALGAWRGWSRPPPAVSAAALLFFVPLLAWRPAFPFFAGILNEFGLGVPTVSGLEFKAAGLLGSPAFHGALTVLALCSLGVWLGRRRELREEAGSLSGRLLLFPAALILGLSLLGASFYDRYLIPLLPAALIVCARLSVPGRLPAAATALFLLWSLAGSADYLNWSEAKWQAGRAARGRGIPPQRLLNGLDWSGMHGYEKAIARLRETKPVSEIGPLEWLDPSRFEAAISFSPASAQILLELRYPTPLGEGRLFVHRLAREKPR